MSDPAPKVSKVNTTSGAAAAAPQAAGGAAAPTQPAAAGDGGGGIGGTILAGLSALRNALAGGGEAEPATSGSASQAPAVGSAAKASRAFDFDAAAAAAKASPTDVDEPADAAATAGTTPDISPTHSKSGTASGTGSGSSTLKDALPPSTAAAAGPTVSAAGAAGAAGTGGAGGTDTRRSSTSTVKSGGSLVHVDHSDAVPSSPETVLHSADAIIESGTSSPLATAAKASAAAAAAAGDATAGSEPNSGHNSGMSSPVLAPSPAQPPAPAPIDSKTKYEEELKKLRDRLEANNALLVQQAAKLQLLEKQEAERQKMLLTIPAKTGDKLTPEQFSTLQVELQTVKESNARLEKELALAKKDLAATRDALMKQDADETNTSAYKNGHAAGYAQKHAEDLLALQQAEQKRAKAQQEAEDAKATQAAAVTHAHNVQRAAAAAAAAQPIAIQQATAAGVQTGIKVMTANTKLYQNR